MGKGLQEGSGGGEREDARTREQSWCVTLNACVRRHTRLVSATDAAVGQVEATRLENRTCRIGVLGSLPQCVSAQFDHVAQADVPALGGPRTSNPREDSWERKTNKNEIECSIRYGQPHHHVDV